MTETLEGVSLPEVVGKGYGEPWRWRKRYLVIKGSRASKKSKTMALRFIYNMMKHSAANGRSNANLLVVRKTYRTILNSCYAELKWATKRLGVEDYWDFKLSPLEATYIPTGQKIQFRGLDDPLKVTSITVDTGYLCWLWIEEAYEINSENDFSILDESIRGEVPPDLFKQITLSFNPWNEHHWIKKRFFDDPDDETLAVTTNYQCNEWLDEADLKVFETMRQKNPRRYQVAGLGNWGIVDGLVYENWREEAFELKDAQKHKNAFGLDFGYTADPTAFVAAFIDTENEKIYVWDEVYQKGMSNRDIYDTLAEAGYAKDQIVADSAEPKSIDELKYLGARKVQGAKKGKDSINNGIQFIQNFEIIIHPQCVNFLTEIGNYSWSKDKFGKTINKPIDDFNHLMDALRYGVERYNGQKKWLY